jgi:hypothetical protein
MPLHMPILHLIVAISTNLVDLFITHRTRGCCQLHPERLTLLRMRQGVGSRDVRMSLCQHRCYPRYCSRTPLWYLQ